ncbi:zinc finger CCCH domain-containing protein 17 [Nilaparvata lugens]|uniref:Vps41 beta-propeller domain-containing protein n=1 Tax=Laodelphax striatellus TaxID=195883 RepID=A0A482WXI9_LAOST|nr:zinc finger CCCH domain-containing protein 17 [Nilaparvata lugens]RZF38235.1 hypothetical protein LSTR_LSTR005596 [Laodelphax striatellus]
MSFKVIASVSEAERHLRDVVALAFHNGKLYTGADDGKIKIWSPDLKLISEFQAHSVNVYSLAVTDDTLYTCSNDGTIQAWNLSNNEPKKTLQNNPNIEVLRLHLANGKLYSGEDKGNVRVWENDEQVALYEMGEEIWDLLVHGDMLFTARNLDINITEMLPEKQNQFTSRGAVEGRSPIRLAGDKICFMSRCGRNVLLHETTVESRFKQVAQMKAHEMIVNALCVSEEPQLTIYSGGYDNTLKGWDAATQKCTGSLDLGVCINALCSGPKGEIYVASANGHMVRVEAK